MSATLYVISAPSGAGKTSLVKALLERESGIQASVSFTTRAPRPGETDGVEYNFISVEDFSKRIEAGEFLEHAQVFDNFYGSSRVWVERALAGGTDVILEIDWQGARQARAAFPDAVGVFILPPSRAALEERLRGRGQDGEDIIARRMRDAKSEISHYGEYEFVVINDDFDTALDDLSAIARARRLTGAAQGKKLDDLIAAMLA